jgi:hypothetical protein
LLVEPAGGRELGQLVQCEHLALREVEKEAARCRIGRPRGEYQEAAPVARDDPVLLGGQRGQRFG